jgi:nitroreductase
MMTGMELSEAMRTTGAVRRFTADPLPEDVLERILDDARFAPTGGNRQGVRVIVVRDPSTRQALAELSLPGAKRYLAQHANGEAPWNPLHAPGVDDATVAATDGTAMVASLLGAQVLLVICLDLGAVAATDQELDRIGVVSGASVYPFVWNVLLAARGEGFGGVLTTMAVAQEPAVRTLLNIPDDYAVAAVVPLGKPERQPTKLKRKPLSDIVTRERFDGEPLSASP